jgi:hypothetical protein
MVLDKQARGRPPATNDKVRYVVTATLLSLLAVAAIGSVLVIVSRYLTSPVPLADRGPAELFRDFLAVLSVPVTGLVAAVVGFHFAK